MPNFPAEHWKHLRTTNPIESTFATGHRVRSKGCLSNKTAAMVFKLAQAARTVRGASIRTHTTASI